MLIPRSHIALTKKEIEVLDHAVKDEPGRTGDESLFHNNLIKIARLGGYLQQPIATLLGTRSCGGGCTA